MPEAFSWREGHIVLFTGNAVPITSAPVTYARNLNGNLAYGWDNRVAANGQYRDHLTGQRADITIGAAYTQSMTLQKMVQSATAMHLTLNHSSINGSAGYVLYSGRVDSLALEGAEDGILTYRLQYHANVWSAWGG